MRLVITEFCTLEASKETCDKVTESFKLTKAEKELRFSHIPEGWDIYDYFEELEYLNGRANLLLGIYEPTERNLEIYGKI